MEKIGFSEHLKRSINTEIMQKKKGTSTPVYLVHIVFTAL
jgi:hypothetical protein